MYVAKNVNDIFDEYRGRTNSNQEVCHTFVWSDPQNVLREDTCFNFIAHQK